MKKHLLIITLLLGMLGFSAKAADPVEVELLPNINVYFENWNADPYYMMFNKGGLYSGDELNVIVHGNQIQFYYVDANKSSVKVGGSEFILFNGNNWLDMQNWDGNNPSTVTVKVTDENVDALNAGGLCINGDNFTLHKVTYKGQNPNITAVGSVGKNSGGEEQPEPGETHKGVLFEGKYVEDHGICLNLWMDWNKDDCQYIVHFNQEFEKGDKLIFELCETYGGQIEFRNPNNQNEILLNQSSGNNGKSLSSITFNITEDRIASIINEYGLVLTGNNYKVHKISYEGKNEPVAGGYIEDFNHNVKFGDNDAEEDTEVYEEARVVDLLNRIQELSYINKHWDGVTVENTGETVKATTTKGEGFGVMSKALAELQKSGTELSNDLYNGTKAELDMYGKNTEPNGKTGDEFLDFHRFERAIITLDKQVNGARVVLYYRDLDWDDYNDDTVEEYPEYVEFNRNTTTFKVDLTPYRYLRAIALRVPEAGEYNVTRFFLYERKEYAEEKKNTDEGVTGVGKSLAVEIWHPSDDDSGATLYEGQHLGIKRMYGSDDEWRCDEGETLAWANDITIDGDVFKKYITDDTKIQYHCIGIVYKNATTVDGYENAGPTHGQIQMYINFPCYRTNKMTAEQKEFWANTTWSDHERDYENNNIISPINEDNKDKGYGDDVIFTPSIRDSHCLRTVDADEAQDYGGSMYLDIPDSKHDQYTFGRIYLNVQREIGYPVMASQAAGIRTLAAGDVQTQKGSVLDLLHANGLAIRGQNVSVMKVVYLGDLTTEEPDFEPEEDNNYSGIDEVAAEAADVYPADVYNLQGMKVRSGVTDESQLRELGAGVYIVGGKKIQVK